MAINLTKIEIAEMTSCAKKCIVSISACSLAKLLFDTAENELSKVCPTERGSAVSMEDSSTPRP